jgi:nucleoside-diphosphate-sugar epimerase
LRLLPEHPELDTKVAELNDVGALVWLSLGSDLVVHTAAVVEEDGDWEAFRRVNVEGTRILVQTCKSTHVPTVIHLSSVMVYGFDYPEMVDETFKLRSVDNPYCQTKIESERAAIEVGHPRLIIVRPGDIYGAGSRPWVERPLAMMKAGAFLLPSTGLGKLNPIYIDDVVQGILLASEHGKSNDSYNLTSGQAVEVREYFVRLANAFGYSGSVRFVPRNVVETSLKLAAKVPSLSKDLPSLTTLKFLERPGSYSISRAQKVLGFRPEFDFVRGLAALGDCR